MMKNIINLKRETIIISIIWGAIMKKKPISISDRKENLDFFITYDDDQSNIKKLGINYFLLRLEIIESFLKSLNFIVIGIGVGIFLITVYFGILAFVSEPSTFLPMIFFYLALITIMITLLLVKRIHDKLFRDKMKTLRRLKIFEESEKRKF